MRIIQHDENFDVTHCCDRMRLDWIDQFVWFDGSAQPPVVSIQKWEYNSETTDSLPIDYCPFCGSSIALHRQS